MKEKQQIITAEFIASYPEYALAGHTENPEYAFTGRSNVGKSSLINLITGRTNLALTSGTPGKTRLLNLFLINKTWNLMDLPGMGYAKVSKSERKTWEKTIRSYILNRKNLVNVFVLIDSNIPPQEIDLEFIEFLGENLVPFSVVFTKCDRMKKMALSSNIMLFKKELLKNWEELPPIFLTSSVTKEGRDEIVDYIFKTNSQVTIV